MFNNFQEEQSAAKANILKSYNLPKVENSNSIVLPIVQRTMDVIESALQKSEENDLEKGGEGSKGGKVIGHTKSGKAIYETPNHEKHKDFSKEDHKDAHKVHTDIGDKHRDTSKEYADDGAEEGSERHSKLAGKHYDAADTHKTFSRTAKKEIKKSEEVVAMSKGVTIGTVSLDGKFIKSETGWNKVIKEVIEKAEDNNIEKGRKGVALGTKSKDGKYEKTSDGWKKLKSEKTDKSDDDKLFQGQVNAIVSQSLEAYNKASDEKKAQLKKHVEDSLKSHEDGLQHIGMGLDDKMVAAGKLFLEKIKKQEKPVSKKKVKEETDDEKLEREYHEKNMAEVKAETKTRKGNEITDKVKTTAQEKLDSIKNGEPSHRLITHDNGMKLREVIQANKGKDKGTYSRYHMQPNGDKSTSVQINSSLDEHEVLRHLTHSIADHHATKNNE